MELNVNISNDSVINDLNLDFDWSDIELWPLQKAPIRRCIILIEFKGLTHRS